MKSKARRPLGLEALEDRWVPATVRFDGSNLFVSAPQVSAGASGIQVVEQAGATPIFQVKDGTTAATAANNGFYLVTGNITINGNNASDQVEVLLTGTGLAGSLSVTTGNGPSSITVDGTTAATLGLIAGNVNVTMGNGSNSVWVGSHQGAGTGEFVGPSTGLFVRGNVSLNSRGNSGNKAFVNNAPTAPPWIFSGNTYVSGFPTVLLGATANVFAGSVTVSNTLNGQPGTVTVNGTVLGNLTVLGSIGGNTTVAINNNVLGQTTLNLGNGTNSVALGGGAAAITLGGSLNYTAGNGGNTFTANAKNAATVLGCVNVHLGNGANAFGSSAGLTVEGNMLINDGNGGLDVATNKFLGNVFGTLAVNNGNGGNKFELDVTDGANIGSAFNYTGGNGGNSVTVDNITANMTALNIRFGTLPANLVTLNAGAPGNGNLTGTITWAVPSAFVAGVNGFVDNGYVWTNYVTLTNIPS